LKTRAFFQTLFALAALMIACAAAAQSQYYELRIYSTKSEAQQKLINDYWQKAAVPAYNRLGVSAVGVFTELADATNSKV
jgi:uncharacterized lipoprotein YmbA